MNRSKEGTPHSIAAKVSSGGEEMRVLKKGMSCTQKGNDTPGEKPRAISQVAD